MPHAQPASHGPFTLAVVTTVGVIAGLVGFTAAAGLRDSMPLAAAAGVAAAAIASWRLRARLRHADATASAPPWARRLFVAGAVLGLVQLVPLTAFIIDPNVATWPAGPARPWQSRHSCVSCYWVAAEKARAVPDLYVESVYRPPVAPTVARRPNLGPFFVDVYEYPPTFLPLPRLLAQVTPDFWGFRRLWFALNLACVCLGLVVIARRVDAAFGTFTVWLTPWVMVAPSVVGTLQAGNVQLLFVVQSAVAMLLFERRRHALGGLLLGYAIASKIYPGVLVVYLLLRRDWRAAVSTTAAGVAIALVTLVDVGWTPFAAFLSHVPKILSGEAFPGLFRPEALAINESIPGIVFKLQLFGVEGMSLPESRLVGWIYTAVLIATIIRLARRDGDRRDEPLLWIAILILATLRSPFLPGYGAFPSLWLASLIAGIAWSHRSLRVEAIACWLVLAVSLGQGYASPPVNALLTFAHTMAALVLVFAILPRVTRAPAVASVSGSPAPLPA